MKTKYLTLFLLLLGMVGCASKPKQYDVLLAAFDSQDHIIRAEQVVAPDTNAWFCYFTVDKIQGSAWTAAFLWSNGGWKLVKSGDGHDFFIGFSYSLPTSDLVSREVAAIPPIRKDLKW